ncbi:MAG: redoxin domain-containing protein [Gammaproteobacteria bacterium]|nr:redoxin domain-containing protein [Gammaproteobacteria bacterium]|tara:strand:- start:1939 stop:3645 length:1707 start_codon:yes stop_codon:yes gene_type:complete
MDKLRDLVIAALAITLTSFTYALPDRIGDFALLDSDGAFHQLSRYRNREALVLMSFDNRCASIDTAVGQLKSLQRDWSDQGVAFGLIDSSGEADIQTIRATKARHGLDLPLLIDNGQLVTETLRLTRAGEVAILDPERLTLIYRGVALESAAQSLANEIAGTTDNTIITESAGCELNFSMRESHLAITPDYATEIAPIIAEQCASCHREGGIGPFAMDSHLMLQGWSPMIREVLLTKRMPPTQVDPYIGHFSNARYISDLDLQRLVHWIDAGAPRGGADIDPLTELQFPDRREWQLGEPDFIVKAPVHEIPATGVLDYINIEVELPFEEDKWVRAVQYIAGDEAVLHHLLSYVTAPREAVQEESPVAVNASTRFLEGYAPGKVDAIAFPQNTGVYIPQGYNLSMQFHYTPNGRATVDETLLGLYMHDDPPAYENFTESVSGMFRIPPFAGNHAASAEYVFAEDVVVTGLRPHMHFRGKDMKLSAELPDGSITELLSVPNYSYAWQPTYALEEPVNLPAGTMVHVTGTFDNSEYNPANPDPSKELTFGLQSWDEMFIGYWTYHSAEPTN